MVKTVLVTGAVGFIGYHVASRFLLQGMKVVGLDNLNDYYDVSLKLASEIESNKTQCEFRILETRPTKSFCYVGTIP